MQLPYAENAIIAPEKLTEYLLKLDHPKGGSKAKFFLSHGFSIDNLQRMINALMEHMLTYNVSEVVINPNAVNYVIDGEIRAPDGAFPYITSRVASSRWHHNAASKFGLPHTKETEFPHDRRI
jgi:hypothetical protein